jgi:YHYH protein
MFKTFKIIALVSVSALAVIIPTQQVSAASVGGSCSKAGLLAGTASNPLICKKVGKKLKWAKNVTATTTATTAATTATTAATTATTAATTATTATTTTTVASGAVGLRTSGECPTARFPSISTSAGTSYAKPSISVSCTDSVVTVVSNDMIGYPFVVKTPHALAAQSYTWKIARNPAVAASPTAIGGTTPTMGTLGFTTTGLAFFGPTEGPYPAAAPYGDPNYNGLLDTCGGHAGPGDAYHNHVLYHVAACNLKSLAILGYAIDGFPVYGPTACLNVACTSTGTVRSGYTKTGNPASNVWLAYTYTASSDALVLDACNGRTQPDGSYGYHAITSFPYILGCLKGTATVQSGAAAAPMPPMTNNAEQSSDVKASSANTLHSIEGLSVYCVINRLS